MDVKIGSMNVSIWSILLIIGGLLAFIGMFLDYVVIDYYLDTEGISGLDLVSEDDYGGLTYLSKFPLVIGILGLLSLVAAVLPMFVKGQDKIFTIAGALFAVVAVVLAIWFFVQGVGPGLFEEGLVRAFFENAEDKITAGIGLYLALVGSIVAAVGGILNLKEAL